MKRVQKESEIEFPGEHLPPLPERVITGVPSERMEEFNGSPFHTVHVWEFTNLYILLNRSLWQTISTFLQDDNNHTAVARKLKQRHGTLFLLKKNPNQSIHIDMLKTIVEVMQLEPNQVEQAIRAVKFDTRGDPENIKFPFKMDLYAWRVLCHIFGDGNVNEREDRRYPELRWTQEPKYQAPMRTLLGKLSRRPKGESMNINYPKALTYAILGTIPDLTINDLKTSKFLQFIIDLPTEFTDYKIQFLAAFAVDDGSITKDISFTQKNKINLKFMMELCDQMEYDYSPLYQNERDDVNNFQLRQEGIQSFLYDIEPLYNQDSLFGLWHKHERLYSVINNFSPERKQDQNFSVFICTTIIEILGNFDVYSTTDLKNHPKLHNYLQNYPDYWFNRRIELLIDKNIIKEAYNSNGRSFRPKRWYIPQTSNSNVLINEFLKSYNQRSHPQSYKRRNLTPDMIESAIKELKVQGLDTGAKSVSKLLKCSKKQLYKRKDLRRYFIDE